MNEQNKEIIPVDKTIQQNIEIRNQLIAQHTTTAQIISQARDFYIIQVMNDKGLDQSGWVYDMDKGGFVSKEGKGESNEKL